MAPLPWTWRAACSFRTTALSRPDRAIRWAVARPSHEQGGHTDRLARPPCPLHQEMSRSCVHRSTWGRTTPSQRRACTALASNGLISQLLNRRYLRRSKKLVTGSRELRACMPRQSATGSCARVHACVRAHVCVRLCVCVCVCCCGVALCAWPRLVLRPLEYGRRCY